MKIIINENQLNLLVEKLGVPDLITKTSEKFYNLILNYLRPIGEETLYDKKIFLINGDFQIGKYVFNEMKIKIDLSINKGYKELVIIHEGISYNPDIHKSNNVYRTRLNDINPENTYLLISFGSPTKNVTINDIINKLEENSSVLIGDLSHELMHLYEIYNKKSESLYNRALYDGVQNISSGFEPLDNMLFSLYYLSKIENITRPSELFSELKMKNITKQKFREYLKNSKMYKNLVEMKNFNLDSIIEDLKTNYSKQIDDIFNDSEEYKYKSIDEKIEQIFRAIYIGIVNYGIKVLRNQLSQNPFEIFLGLENEKQNMITKFSKRFENNLPNFMNYYRKKEKEINYQANNMIRKISKLYDLLPDESEQNSNIKDLDEWYLVQKNKKLKPIDFTKQKIDF
jgi:hypothetical protein